MSLILTGATAMQTPGRSPSIAILSTASSIGGMERVVCGLAREFTARGLRVQTVFPDSQNRDALLRWCAEQGVLAETSPAVLDAAAPHTWTTTLRLARYIRDSAPAAVSLHYGGNFISAKDLLAVRLSGLRRCVVTVNHPTSWAQTRRRKRLVTRLSSHLAGGITTISHATHKVLREAGVPGRRIHLIPCGLRVPTQLLDRDEARARLGIPATATVIGSLSRLVPHKGLTDLIDAVVPLARARPDLYLAIAGDGPERSALQARAASLPPGQARMFGRVASVDDFLAACDIFALPSHLEGFGLVFIEAAFHALPSIAADVGGVPDAVVHGQTGLLVPLGDVGELTVAIQRLCDDPDLRLRLGTAARARAHREFTEAVMADRFHEVLFPGADSSPEAPSGGWGPRR